MIIPQAARVQIADVFVEPACTQYLRRDKETRQILGENERRGTGEDQGLRYTQREPYLAITAAARLKDDQPIPVFLGESGSGKSTFLRFVASTLAHLALAKPPEPGAKQNLAWKPRFDETFGRPFIPVYIDLRNRSDSDNTFGELVEQTVRRQIRSRSIVDREWNAFSAAVDAGNVLFLIDNVQLALPIWRNIAEFIRNKLANGCWFVLASRRLPSEEQSLRSLGVPVRDFWLAPFDWKRCEQLAKKWCATQTGIDTDKIVKDLQYIVKNDKSGDLLRHPLHVSVLVSCLLGGVDRNKLLSVAEIWDQYIQRTLRSTHLKRLGGPTTASRDKLQDDLDTDRAKRVVLEKLAYLSFGRRANNEPAHLSVRDCADVIEEHIGDESAKENDGVWTALASQFREMVVGNLHMLQPTREARSGNGEKEGPFVFSHEELEAFLSGCELFRRPDFSKVMLDVCDRELPMNAIALGIEYLTRVKGEVARAISALAAVQKMVDHKPTLRARRLWLAAEIANAIGFKNLRKDPVGRRSLRITGALKAIVTAGLLEPSERARIGRILAHLGDPRPKVGVKHGIPNIDWVEIPGGQFDFAEHVVDHEKDADYLDGLDWRTKDLPTFFISRYPITCSQYRAFLKEVKARDVPQEVLAALVDPEKLLDYDREMFRYGNHPCDSVSWFEATAFCRWLTNKLGTTVRLPTAEEWEKAARGSERKVYAFGNDCGPSLANTSESRLGRPSPVGMYPGGVSCYGVHDMTGNVFEWCSDGQEGRAEKYTRGGSWNHPTRRCRISLESSQKIPEEHHPYIGFRVVAETARTPGVPCVAIIGSGAAGTITAIRLLRHSRGPLRLIRIDREKKRINGGLAYSEATADWAFMFNLQAGRISVLREEQFDFVNWINEEADRSDWPRAWDKVYAPSDAAPRRAYQLYLRDRLEREKAHSRGRVTIEEKIGYVKDVVDAHGTMRLTIHTDKADETIEADHVVLATGHVQARVPKALQRFRTTGIHSKCILDLYSAESQCTLKNLRGDEDILVIGTGLRALDVLTLLLRPCDSEKRTDADELAPKPHDGKIWLISRGAHQHESYPDDHLHDVIQIPEPDWAKLAEIEQTEESYREFLKMEFGKAEAHVRGRDPLISDKVRRERILKAAERWIPNAVGKIPAAILPKLLMSADSIITASRVGVVAAIGQLSKNPNVEVRAGEVMDVEPFLANSGQERFRVSWVAADGTEHTSEHDVVISCLGREADYERIKQEDQLWKSLIETGKAEPHSQTGRGVRVGDWGELLDRQHQPQERLTVVGLPREGDELVRHGRLGAFTFALGPLKNQAFGSALHVLRVIGDYGEPLSNFECYGERRGAHRSPAGVVSDAVMKTWKDSGGAADEDALKWKMAITEHVNQTFHKYAGKVIKAMRNPHDPGAAALYMGIAEGMRTVLIPCQAPTEIVSLSVAHLIAQLEENAMRHLTDISVVQTGEDRAAPSSSDARNDTEQKTEEHFP